MSGTGDLVREDIPHGCLPAEEGIGHPGGVSVKPGEDFRDIGAALPEGDSKPEFVI